MKNLILLCSLVSTLFAAEVAAEKDEAVAKEEKKVEQVAAKEKTAEANPEVEVKAAVKDESVSAEEVTSVDTATVAAKTGITLETEPTGATLKIGDKEFTSPAVIELPAGKHSIEIRKSGYYAKKVTVEIPQDSMLQETVALRAPGKLKLTCTPDSARVLVNKMPVGYSPYSSKPMKPGTYEVIVVKTGYVTYRDSVVIKSGEEAQLTLTLESKNPQPVVESVGPADGSSDKALTHEERTAANTNTKSATKKALAKKEGETVKEDSEKTKRVTRIIAGSLFAAFLAMLASFELSNVGE